MKDEKKKRETYLVMETKEIFTKNAEGKWVSDGETKVKKSYTRNKKWVKKSGEEPDCSMQTAPKAKNLSESESCSDFSFNFSCDYYSEPEDLQAEVQQVEHGKTPERCEKNSTEKKDSLRGRPPGDKSDQKQSGRSAGGKAAGYRNKKATGKQRRKKGKGNKKKNNKKKSQKR